MNKVTWSELFMKQKPVQQIVADFQIELFRCLEKEIQFNKLQLRNYLCFPRKNHKEKKRNLANLSNLD